LTKNNTALTAVGNQQPAKAISNWQIAKETGPRINAKDANHILVVIRSVAEIHGYSLFIRGYPPKSSAEHLFG
jgi:hypothetical protein